MRQTTIKLCLYILAGVILCGCGRPHHLSLYHKYYTPALSEKEVRTLKSSGNYPKKVVVKGGLGRAEAGGFNSVLISFYGCIVLGQSHFQGKDEVITYDDWSGYIRTFSTDDAKDPERLAQKVGANYYITYSEYTNPSTTTTGGVDTKVAAQGGMGRVQTSANTTTTHAGGTLLRGAVFYLCD